MSVLATDNFDRADAGTLGANWTKAGDQGGGDPDMSISSNQAATTLGYGATYCMIYTGVACPDDHYSQVKLINSLSVHAVAARVTGFDNCYLYGRGHGVWGGSTTVYRLWKVVAGTPTDLGAGSIALAAGDDIKISAQGTTIKGFVNGVEDISVTDSSLTGGDFGIYVFATSAAARFDDWEGGDFSSGAPLMGQICV